MKEPHIAASARKHGVGDDVIRHAFNNPLLVEEIEDDLTMPIGPDPAGNLFETGVIGSDEGPIVVHAMRARPKYLR